MNTVKENLLLHPVRLRIILAVAGREITAQQLAAELPDIPQATLYRNIKTLAVAGMLAVVGERRVHNTVEKTYALPEQGLMLGLPDLKNAQPEDYIRLVTRYFGLLLSYYVRYIQSGPADLAGENSLFQMAPLYLSQREARALGPVLKKALRPFADNKPSAQRQRTLLGLISFPDVVEGPAPAVRKPAARKTQRPAKTGKK